MKLLNDIADLRATLAPVYSRYPREINPQPAYIAIDLEARTVEADYNGEIGNAVPAGVYYGAVRRIPLTPYARGSELATFLESDAFRTLVERVMVGFAWIRDGNHDLVVGMTGDALAAEKELERATEAYFDPAEHVRVHTVAAWMEKSMYTNESTGDVVLGDDDVVSAATTDEELARLAAFVRESAAKEGVELESGVLDWLTELRADCIRAQIKATYDAALVAACALATPEERRAACDAAHVRYEQACAAAGIQLPDE